MDKVSDDAIFDQHPLPDDFQSFLPYACKQYEMDFVVSITKDLQHEYVSVGQQERIKRGKSKAKLASKIDVGSDDSRDGNTEAIQSLNSPSKTLHITATYDNTDNLTKIKFTRNNHIPRKIWKILALTIPYQTHLTNITINGGIDKYSIYEISKLLNYSQITELVLDYSILSEMNYYLLFETENSLRHVSLAGCEIDSSILYTITSKLSYPLPSSKKLKVLNLSSNKISDTGAEHVANALRSNRNLNYLNLSSNRLTDIGASYILNVLSEFPLLNDEIMASRQRHMDYLLRKNDIVQKLLHDLKAGDLDRRSAKRKSLRPQTAPKRGKLEKDVSLKSLADGNAKSIANVDMILYDKALSIAETTLGDFDDPFGNDNTIIKDDLVYCKGNNSLVYLNFGYNQLSYLSVQKILDVLSYQRSLERRLSGLINIIIEGNPLPVCSWRLREIDDIIDRDLESRRRTSIYNKKRPHSKTVK